MKLRVTRPTGVVLTDRAAATRLLELAEVAGRNCYQSEPRGNPQAFLRKIIKMGHLSVIEHVNLTAMITCSRACSHQLVRHRIASYSQESQRYCVYDDGLEIIVPPTVGELEPGTYTWHGDVDNPYWDLRGRCLEFSRSTQLALDQCRRAYGAYRELIDAGVPKEDARYLLPNATRTKIVTTFNAREWRHVLEERALNDHAQWEIRGIMNEIFGSLLTSAVACLFEDLAHDRASGVSGRPEAADVAGHRGEHGRKTGPEVVGATVGRVLASSMEGEAGEPAGGGPRDGGETVEHDGTRDEPEVPEDLGEALPYRDVVGAEGGPEGDTSVHPFDDVAMHWRVGHSLFRHREHAEAYTHGFPDAGNERYKNSVAGRTIRYGETVVAVMRSAELAKSIAPYLKHIGAN